MAHPNEDRIRQALDVFASGDLGTMGEFIAEDAVWHSGGNNVLSGDYTGLNDILAQFGRVFQETNGTFRLDVHDVLANDTHGVVLATSNAERKGKTLHDNGVQVIHLRDGKLTESWLHPEDQKAVDDFFS